MQYRHRFDVNKNGCGGEQPQHYRADYRDDAQVSLGVPSLFLRPGSSLDLGRQALASDSR